MDYENVQAIELSSRVALRLGQQSQECVREDPEGSWRVVYGSEIESGIANVLAMAFEAKDACLS